MGRVLGMTLGIGLLCSLIVFVVLNMRGSSSLNTGPLETVHTSRAISVSVPKLWTDYHENEVAADDLYKGKRLVVEGQVASVNKGTADNAYVLLSTYDDLAPIHADIKAEDQAEATTLRIGQVITVDCEGAGMTMGDLFLMNCSIPLNASLQSEPQLEAQPQTAPIGAVQKASANSNGLQNPSPTEKQVTLPTVIYLAPAKYTAEARRNKLEGIVQVRLLVDENGNPQNVTVVRSLGMGLDESAVEAVKHYKFKAAVDTSSGKPVSAWMNIGLQFRLP